MVIDRDPAALAIANELAAADSRVCVAQGSFGAIGKIAEAHNLQGRVDGILLDLYGGAPEMGNVIKAMSLVPDSVRLLTILGEQHYMAPKDVADPTSNSGRAISRPQIELLAGRVSSLSDCFY